MTKLTYEKRYWVAKKVLSGYPIAKICAAQKISRETLYAIKAKYLYFGVEGLRDKPAGRKADEILKETKRKVVELRLNKGYGPCLIEHLTGISHNKVYKVLVERGLITPNPEKRRQRKWVRWERTHSNSLWQVDFKWIDDTHKWLCAYLDDHSRLITAASYLEAATTDNALWLLEKGIEKYGKPRVVLSDHGTQFYAVRGGESMYAAKLEELGIDHILSRIRHPQTTGKIERLWRTYIAEAYRFGDLNEFVENYNTQRPHMSLGFRTPQAVFERDLKKNGMQN